jgi:beta-glucosidase
MKAGYEAQLKSVVLLKNHSNTLPLAKQKTAYVPKRFTPAGRNFLGVPIPEKLDYPVNMDIVRKYFNVTDNPAEADVALVFIESPNTGNGYKAEDVKKGGNGYFPISLQYGEYKATEARETSLAGGDPLESFTNRTYKNKKITATNVSDLAMVNDTYAKMKGKPVIVSIKLNNPAIVSEFEKNASAIVAHFGALDQALMEILSGGAEPSALLPLQLPANMSTVEKQAEDLPHDMECYVDTDGNKYDFAYGLNWKGVISDDRTARYKKKILTD